MKKIALELDSLTVESFETDAVAHERGTIHGHLDSDKGDCGSFIDNCPSGMCATIRPEDCVSFDPAACETGSFTCSGSGCL